MPPVRRHPVHRHQPPQPPVEHRRPRQRRDPEKAVRQQPIVRRIPQRTIQTDENRNRRQRRQAPRQRIHPRRLVQLGSLHLETLLVVRVLGLQLLHRRLQLLHPQRRLHLLRRQRIRRQLDQQRQHDDAKPVRIRNVQARQPRVDHLEKRLERVCKDGHETTRLLRHIRRHIHHVRRHRAGRVRQHRQPVHLRGHQGHPCRRMARRLLRHLRRILRRQCPHFYSMNRP
mmetsp:Transcript_3884/g.11131  ORF Transcript_3884/g.11131 Transcript_3884/m.11131 type:complete len:228 (-) Transcript_3884:239-922(-)